MYGMYTMQLTDRGLLPTGSNDFRPCLCCLDDMQASRVGYPLTGLPCVANYGGGLDRRNAVAYTPHFGQFLRASLAGGLTLPNGTAIKEPTIWYGAPWEKTLQELGVIKLNRAPFQPCGAPLCPLDYMALNCLYCTWCRSSVPQKMVDQIKQSIDHLFSHANEWSEATTTAPTCAHAIVELSKREGTAALIQLADEQLSASCKGNTALQVDSLAQLGCTSTLCGWLYRMIGSIGAELLNGYWDKPGLSQMFTAVAPLQVYSPIGTTVYSVSLIQGTNRWAWTVFSPICPYVTSTGVSTSHQMAINDLYATCFPMHSAMRDLYYWIGLWGDDRPPIVAIDGDATDTQVMHDFLNPPEEGSVTSGGPSPSPSSGTGSTSTAPTRKVPIISAASIEETAWRTQKMAEMMANAEPPPTLPYNYKDREEAGFSGVM